MMNTNDFDRLGEIMDHIVKKGYLEDRGEYDIGMLQKAYELRFEDATALKLLISVEMCRNSK